MPAHKAKVEILEASAPLAVEEGSGAYLLRAAAGKVRLRAQAPGYLPQILEVQLSTTKAVTQDFYLEQATAQEVEFQITDTAGRSLSDGLVTVYREVEIAPVFPAQKAVNGQLRLQLLPGNYVVQAGAPGYLPRQLPLEVPQNTTAGNLQALNFPACASDQHGSPQWTTYSDATSSYGLTTLPVAKIAAVRFDAQDSEYVTAVQFFVFNSANTAQEFEWTVWDADDLDGLPGKMLSTNRVCITPNSTSASATNSRATHGQWVEVKLAHPVAVSGSYYISYKQFTDPKQGTILGIDTSEKGVETDNERSFKLINNAWSTPDENGQFMIGAQVAKYAAAAAPDPAAPDSPLDTAEQNQPDNQPGNQPDNQPSANADADASNTNVLPPTEPNREADQLENSAALDSGSAALI